MFDKNIICHLAKKYSKILKQRQYNYFLLTDQNSTEACLYYNFFPKNKDITIKQAASKGIELDKLHSFKYLPDTNNFPKALKASQNHLAFALLRPAKDIQKIKKVIQWESQSKNNIPSNYLPS